MFNTVRRKSLSTVSRSIRNCSSVLKSPIETVTYPKGNFYENLSNTVLKFQNSVALQCGITGQKTTYAELHDKSARWSGFLRKQKLKKGDRMGLILPNCPQYVSLYLGASRLGVATAPIPAIFGKDEMLHQLKVTKPKLVVVWDQVRPVLEEAVKELGYSPKIISTEFLQPNKGVEEILSDRNIDFVNPEQLAGDEEAYVCFSGGTTGLPKGVSVCHNALSANNKQINDPYFFSPLQTENGLGQDSVLALLPFYHMAGLAVVMNSKLEAGCRIVTLPKFEPEPFMKTIKEQEITIVPVVPSILDFMLQREDVNYRNLPHFRSLVVGAAPVSKIAAERLLDKMENYTIIQEGYGMTEVMIATVVPPDSNVIGSSGILLPGFEAQIVDLETREPVPINSPGELIMKSPTIMTGYIDNEEATRKTIQGGYVLSGDIATVDEDGFIRIIDRVKDIIKCRGIQVSPTEVENIIKKHQDVISVSVIGIPHDKYGEVPKAYIVSKKPSQKKAEEIINFTNSKLTKYKHLVGGIEFVDALPTSPVGKVLRRKLVEKEKSEN